MVRSRSIGLIGRILSFALISDIGNISRVGIPNIVGDNLGTAIGKSNAVFARGSNTITVLTLSKIGTRVVISDSITVMVESWAFISRLMVSGSRVSGFVGGSLVNNGSGVVDRSGFVDNRGRVVDRSRFVDGGTIVDRGRVVDRSGFVDNRGRVVDRSRFVDRGTIVDRGRVVDGSRIVDRSLVVDGRVGVDVGVGLSMSMVNGVTVDVVGKTMGTMNGSMVTVKGSMVSMIKVKGMVVARSVDTSNIFLLVVVLVNLIGSGSGLGVHNCVIFTMGFVDGGGDSRGIAVLDALVAVLVSGSQGQEGRENDKSLHVFMMVIDRTKFQ